MIDTINRLLKQHRQMADTFKSLSKNGGKGFGQMAKLLGGGDMSKLAQMGGGQAPTPEQMEQMAAQLKSMPGSGGLGGMPKLPGLGGGGLPRGLNPFKK